LRIMGLDLGEKTIGVALSDPLGWTAQGIKVIKRDKNKKYQKIEALRDANSESTKFRIRNQLSKYKRKS